MRTLMGLLLGLTVMGLMGSVGPALADICGGTPCVESADIIDNEITTGDIHNG